MLNFTGLKFKNEEEVKHGDVCALVEKDTDETVFIGGAIGNGLLRGHLENDDDIVPANMMTDTHYLVKVGN